MATGTTKRPAAARTSATRKTTTRKAPAKKTTARNSAAVKAAAPAPASAKAATVVKAAPAAPGPADLRKKELIDLVVEQSGVKKKDAKPVVEAMLAILGESLASGRELNLQPFGKLRINRSEERSNGRIIVCKLRQANASGEKSQDDEKSAATPLADAEG